MCMNHLISTNNDLTKKLSAEVCKVELNNYISVVEYLPNYLFIKYYLAFYY